MEQNNINYIDSEKVYLQAVPKLEYTKIQSIDETLAVNYMISFYNKVFLPSAETFLTLS